MPSAFVRIVFARKKQGTREGFPSFQIWLRPTFGFASFLRSPEAHFAGGGLQAHAGRMKRRSRPFGVGLGGGVHVQKHRFAGDIENARFISGPLLP
jgi:hypothetical protein